MDKKSIEKFRGIEVKLVVQFSYSDQILYFTGKIKSVSSSTTEFVDKFDKLISIDSSCIKKIESV
jgi:hypothetical protein